MAPFKLKFRTSSSRNASQEASTTSTTTSDTSAILNEQQQQQQQQQQKTSISSLLNYSNLSEIGASNSTIDSTADCTSIESYSNNDRKLLLSSSSNNPSNTNSILGYLNPTLSQSEDCVESNKSQLSYDRNSEENLPNNMESENLTLTTFDSVNCSSDSYSTREMNSSSQDHHNVDDSDTQSLQECTDPDCKMYNSSLHQNNDTSGKRNRNKDNCGNDGDDEDDDDDETISHNETSSIDYLISNNANNSTTSNVMCNEQNCSNNESQQQQQLSQSNSQLSLRQRESQQQQQQRYYENESDNSLSIDNRDHYQWNQSNNDHNQNDNYNNYQQLSQQSQQHHQQEEITIPEIINNKSSKKIYKAIAKQSGITCKMSDQCRCMECQSHYFDCEFDDNDHQKTDGGLGAGTPMFISEVMHGSACTIL